ncbi:MAG: phenylalanine--tRNA ligase subunit beta [Saprospiraceae bacterium]|nr:phenylalanine--tRNA ligase subunit beta [Candidatus Defluviibacterium haderslevense]
MRISFDWLKDFIDLKDTPEQVADILTSLGLEVEGLEIIEDIPGGLSGVLVGEVLECWPHPNADRLKLTKVNVGNEDLLQIVCGAPNIAQGQKVLVALVGTTLHPLGKDPLTIKLGKIRGEESQGMICAEDELGIGESHDGVKVLDKNARIGQKASEYLGLNSDTILEIGLTPNRADATNHLGVAKDILAWYRIHREGQWVLKVPKIAEHSLVNHLKEMNVVVSNSDHCPRYSGVCLTNIQVGPSPDWLQKRLLAMDQKPVNNVVDITNYVMYELGQPLHAFDYDKIPGHTIHVMTQDESTEFITLDGISRKLRSTDLMICDGNKIPMCIAGVLGGLGSGISEQTSTIFIESAHFNASKVRTTSMFHLIRTQAAKCFEKGTDPNITLTALERAVYLLQSVCNAEIASDWIDVYPQKMVNPEIQVSLEEVRTLTGINLDGEQLKQILFAMDMSVTDHRNGQYVVEVPTNKPDVRRSADLIEEIARVYGYDQIPVPDQIKMSFPIPLLSGHPLRKYCSDWLVARGLNEIMNISLTSSEMCIKSSIWDKNQLIYINNTSNVSLDVMSPSLALGGLSTILLNQNRQQNDLAFFEFGKSYLREESEIIELQKMGIWLTGFETAIHWSNPKPLSNSIFNIKSLVEGLLSSIGIHHVELNTGGAEEVWAYHLVWSKNQKNLVKAGLLNQNLLQTFQIKKPVFYAEFSIDVLQITQSQQKVTYKDVSKYPSVSRDLALILDKNISFDQLKKEAFSLNINLLKHIDLFDIYENENQLGADKKSYALSFIFESLDHLMTSEEIEKVMERLIKAFESKVGAIIRR